MQFNPDVVNNKTKHLDEILHYEKVLEDALRTMTGAKTVKCTIVSRPWNPGGGSTLFRVTAGKKQYFLKAKRSLLSVESKLEGEAAFSTTPALKNEHAMISSISGSTRHVPQTAQYLELEGFSFLLLEHLTGFDEGIAQFSASQLPAVYYAIEETVRLLYSRDIVHTDIHEHNIMFRGNEPVLVDFEEARTLHQGVPFGESLDAVGRNRFGDVGEMPEGKLAGLTCLQRLQRVFDALILRSIEPLIKDSRFDASTCPFLRALDHGVDERIYQSIDIPGVLSVEGQRPLHDDRSAEILSIATALFRRPIVHLDIGSNLGRFNIELAGDPIIRKSIGAEAFDKYVELSRVVAFLQRRPNVSFIQAECGKDSLTTLLDGERIDLVTIYSVYHHIANREAFLKDLRQLHPSYLMLEMPVQPECYGGRSWEAAVQEICDAMEMPCWYHLSNTHDFQRPVVLVSAGPVQGIRAVKKHEPAPVRNTSGTGPAVSVVVDSITANSVQSVQAILAQTLTDFELIVIRGSSVTVNDPRVKILQSKDKKGMLEIASSEARGTYVSVASPGVVWAPAYLEAMVKALESNPEADAAYASSALIDARGNMVAVRTEGTQPVIEVLGASLEDATLVCRADRLFGNPAPGVVSDQLLRFAASSSMVFVPEILYYAYRTSAHGTMVRTHKEALTQVIERRHTVSAFTESGPAPATPAFPEEVQRHVREADEQFAAGNLSAAREALNEALWIAPDEPELLVAYGNILLRLGDFNGARNEFLKATRIAPDYQPGFANLAALYLHEGDLDRAEKTINAALRLSPEDAASIKLRGIIRLRQDRIGEAEQDFARAVAASPGDTEALMGMASVYLQRGNDAGVRQMLKRVLAIDPAHSEATEGLRRLTQQPRGVTYEECARLLQQGHKDEALKALEAFSADHGEHIDALLDLSALLFEKGDVRRAEASVRKAIALDDAHPIARKNLADILMAQQRFDESVREHMRVLDDNPDDAESLYTIGVINLKIGKTEDAVFFFQRVVAVDPSRDDVRALLSSLEQTAVQR